MYRRYAARDGGRTGSHPGGRRRRVWHVCIGLLVAAVPAAGETLSPPPAEYGYRVMRSLPHDTQASTQGLLIHDGRLFESTGGYGTSTVREVDLETGKVVRERRLADALFAEGLAWVGDRLVQLTWRTGVGFLYEPDTLRPVGSFPYEGEGWGLAFDGERLAMSDGTATLRFLDPGSFRETHRVEVAGPDGPIAGLNELEFVGDALYANVWRTERVAIIDPDSGDLRGWLHLDGILPVVFRREGTAEMNGIAYDEAADRLFVTGKRWPRVFEIEMDALSPQPGEPGEGDGPP